MAESAYARQTARGGVPDLNDPVYARPDAPIRTTRCTPVSDIVNPGGVPCVCRVFAAQRCSASISVVQRCFGGDRDLDCNAEFIAASDPTIRTAKDTAAC
jgi:hypothetical protein